MASSSRTDRDRRPGSRNWSRIKNRKIWRMLWPPPPRTHPSTVATPTAKSVTYVPGLLWSQDDALDLLDELRHELIRCKKVPVLKHRVVVSALHLGGVGVDPQLDPRIRHLALRKRSRSDIRRVSQSSDLPRASMALSTAASHLRWNAVKPSASRTRNTRHSSICRQCHSRASRNQRRNLLVTDPPASA